MHWIDWIIVIIPMLVVVWIGLKSQKYVLGVSDFLTAGRVAGRYVVAVASGEAAMGLISLVAIFEMYYTCGFGVSFWSRISGPLGLVFALTGFCVYRFRETRAMTMGQFLEMRYSKSFRIFAAILQSTSGVINYAIFPAVGGRFLMYYMDLPVKVNIFGWMFPTFGLLMLGFLGVAVLIIMLGGQVTIMATDCIQGILSYPMYVVIVGFVLYKFSWSQEMAPSLLDTAPGKSLLNPYDVYLLRDFNLFYVFVGIFGSIFNRMSWSGTQGYNAAAANAHEQKMGGLLGTWRGGFSVMMYTLLAVAAYTYLHHSNFKTEAKVVHSALTMKTIEDIASDDKYVALRDDVRGFLKDGKLTPAMQERLKDSSIDLSKPITVDDYKTVAQAALAKEDKGKGQTFGTIYSQMLVPMAVREMLPVGITGVFCAIMIFLLVSTDTTYMHSWGSIIVQDAILPLRKKAFTPHQQLLLLRLVIAGVAVFAFLFSFFFAQVDYILMFFAITGAIWLGGAGPVIVFGLYWRRGTTWGAYSALLSGSLLAVGGIICQQTWVKYIYPTMVKLEMIDSVSWFVETVSQPFNPYIMWKVTPDKFPVNSQEIYFIAMVVAVTLYVVISLLTCREKFNLDRLLHRGVYQTEGKALTRIPWSWKTFPTKIIGIDSQYTLGDKILAWSVFVWSFVYGFLLCFVVVIIWNLFQKWPSEWWAHYFYINSILLAGFVGLVSTVWFTIGGSMDLARMFKRLDGRVEDVLDDGRVIGQVSAADLAMVERVEKQEESGK